MYFSQIEPHPRRWRSDSLYRARQDAYDAHRLVWTLFDDRPDRNRDFLFRRIEGPDGFGFLTVSARPPRDPGGLWSISTKEYRPRLSPGEVLVFQVRVNPVRSKRDESGRLHRHDVVMEAKHQLQSRGSPQSDRPSLALLAQEQGRAWLEARAEKNGFRVQPEQIRCDGYRQLASYKRGLKKPIRFSVLDLTGRLEVTDPEQFSKTLFHGLGPAKSFGCGLMLVKRP